MRQSSIVIHRGKKEEKYEIYVEDYVISFLKEQEGKLDEGGLLFYGRKEKNGRRYTIYGVRQDRHPDVFGKYELLEEIGCRLTQEGPAFLVREKDGIYETKGYDVFYYDNEEMQDYLIHRSSEEGSAAVGQNVVTHMTEHFDAPILQNRKKVNSHYALSLQLGLIFVILVAIVINSANSYDKMEQLNRSAEEVFFVMENQEAEETTEVQNDIVVQRETSEDDALQKNVQRENENVNSPDLDGEEEDENEEDGENKEEHVTDGQASNTENMDNTDTEEKKAESEEGGETQSQTEEAEDGNGIEALSRNVARYYEIKRGDTLYMISQKIYGDISHVDKICELNQITDPDNIHYGQKIILP